MNKYQKMKSILLSLDEKPIYISGHLKPDQDSICSCLALASWLDKQGKQVKVLINKKDENLIDWQNGSKFLTNSVEDKLYNFIALDLNEMKRLGEFYDAFSGAQTTINIDHHEDNKFEANYTLSIPSASATCEIIYEIIKPSKTEKLDLTVAEELYSGIMNDTHCFSRRLTKRTLFVTQKLINCGINYARIIRQTNSSRSIYEMKALSKIVDELCFDDGIYYSVVDKSREEFKKLSHNSLVKQIAEEIRKIDSVDVYLMLILNESEIFAKVATNNREDADKIASLFGGGGHKKEAGFTIKRQDIKFIIENVKKYINN